MGLHVVVDTEKLENDEFLLRLINAGIVDRFDVSREEILERMEKMGKGHIVSLFESHREYTHGMKKFDLDFDEASKREDELQKTIETLGGYDLYHDILKSIPIDLKKIRKYMAEYNTSLREDGSSLTSVYKSISLDEVEAVESFVKDIEGAIIAEKEVEDW